MNLYYIVVFFMIVGVFVCVALAAIIALIWRRRE